MGELTARAGTRESTSREVGYGFVSKSNFELRTFLTLKLSFVGAVRGLGQWPASRTKR